MKKLSSILTLFVLFCVGCTNTGCISSKPPAWDKCTLSSNWHGNNANMRMMNMLSPHMKDSSFNDRLNFIKSRGCNTVHLFLTNKSDGEYAGYCIYGNDFDWTIDENYVNVMKDRIKKFRKEDLAVVLWLMADDSNAWAKKVASNPTQYINDIDKLGLFKEASIVVIGLELSEYWNANQVNAIRAALVQKWKGKIGTHDVSNKCPFKDFGDIIFYQIEPTTDQNKVKTACKKALSYGKPVNFFESARQENRKNCETAIQSGCYAVGNW